MCLHLLHLIFEPTHKQAAWLFRAACFFARNDTAGSAFCRHKLGHRRGSSCNYMNAVVPLAYLLYCGYRSGVVASIHDIVQRRLGHSAHKAELIHIYIVLIAELYDPLPNSLSDSHGRHLFPAGKRLPNTACKV